jgi:pentatricopeptide repeat protein
MRKFLVTVFFFIAIHSYGRQADSGKIAFKEAARLDTPDYSIALRMLKAQVKQEPNNAEARYFLGYCIDRINSDHGGLMYLMKKDLTIEASEQFEAVNKLQPKYQGEIFVLDPYAKLSSIWGALAVAYLYKGQEDSATWAFREGKRRGGFTKPLLEFNRQLLNSCSKNAFLLTIGDIIFFNCYYLQHVEKYRTDITIVDANLMSSAWYPKWLRKQKKIELALTDTELDTLHYQQWEKQIITITDPKNTTNQLSWAMPPTYYDQYILKAEINMLDFFKSNYFTRDIYFSINSDTVNNLFLEPYFKNEGLVDKVMPAVVDQHQFFTVTESLEKYNIDHLTEREIQNSPDAISLLNNYRYAYLTAIRSLFNRGQEDKAAELLKEMQKKFDSKKLPYYPNSLNQYVQSLIQVLE